MRFRSDVGTCLWHVELGGDISAHSKYAKAVSIRYCRFWWFDGLLRRGIGYFLVY